MRYEFECRECGRIKVIEGELTKLEEVMLEEQLCYHCATNIYAYCDICKEVEKINDMEEVYNCHTDEWIVMCEDCQEKEDMFYCVEHERYEIDEHPREVVNYGTICSDGWYWGDYFHCPECGDYYHIDNGYWDDDSEEYYCYDCYENVMGSKVVRRYHYHSDDYEYEKRYIKDEKPNEMTNNRIYFGMELEVEDIRGRHTVETMAEKLMKVTDDFVYEHDGSLDDGFEIISFPFTKEYMKQNLQYYLVDMLKELGVGGYGSTESCGLHFHMTKVNWETTLTMIALMEYYRDELTDLSKRSEEKLDRWSSFYIDASKEYLKRIGVKGIEEKMDKQDRSRYRALNITNHNTIEVRIFTSTTNLNELMARWELANNMYMWAIENTLADDFSNIPSFYELATYNEDKFISNYLQNNFPTLYGNKEKATN